MARTPTCRACTDGIGRTGAGDLLKRLIKTILQPNHVLPLLPVRVISGPSCGTRASSSHRSKRTSALALQARVFRFRVHSALSDIFFAVDGRDVRWIFVEIGSPDPKFLAVRVDPVPQAFA